MIVCSYRAFLNVLTQLMNAETLLMANYYIMDHPSQSVNLDDGLKWDPASQQFVNNPAVKTFDTAYSQYAIHVDISKTMDSAPFRSELVAGDMDGARKKYFDLINKPAALSSVYNLIFNDSNLRDSGLKIVLFYDFKTILHFGDIVAEYLAHNFGEDVLLLDKGYHRRVPGKEKYEGDKAFAKRMIQDIWDYDTYNLISQYLGQGYENAKANLTSTFSGKKWTFDMLIYVHNVILPRIKQSCEYYVTPTRYEPLPCDNYTKDQLVEILVYKFCAGLPRISSSDGNSLWYEDDTTWDDYISKY